ncbi:sensor histidine kinase [Paracoccus sp. AK26]|uniref:sensor histidine kinase n=1 Tax=Paracoccus sp. AK26 TaxID=2589076 RepID=UPI0014282B54|nr:HWE histidine kinase domain-containing protein [Paracoccus sp. AK26]QIR84361.1 PAS domain S-box protein [Paracoccus sp. AK26]
MTPLNAPGADPFYFLGHDGPVARLVKDFPWGTTCLGRVETWPQSLKTATALLIHSPVPMVMLWGEQGVMIYNDAYSVFAGHRHPALLGSNVREGWPEVADFNDNVMKVGLAGQTLAYQDQELTLHRKGYPEQVWMNLDYSPVLDETGRPAGVIAVVIETTERVLAERRNRQEFQRLQSLFAQAPTFMAMVSGPDHRFTLVNPEYNKLIGNRDVIGMPVREALPEVTEQGFFDLLDHVFTTGEAITRTSLRVLLRWRDQGPLEERFVDFVYQPIRDQDGTVAHIFVQGSDVTERVRAENHQRLLINELNHRVKNSLAAVQSIVTQTLRHATDPGQAAQAITARIMALSAAHNVLTQESWDSADLRTLAQAAIRPFQAPDRNTIELEGPDMRVGPYAAISIALALHELGTNAVKYGALSVPGGTVLVRWNVSGQSVFTLEWIETGGPVVTKGDYRGFGSRLILQVLPDQLQGKAEVDFRPTGIVFKLTAAVEAISDHAA